MKDTDKKTTFVEREFKECKDGFYDDNGFYMTPNGSFWDPDGYYFNKEGYDKHGILFKENSNFI
jgi:hypothetical protein